MIKNVVLLILIGGILCSSEGYSDAVQEPKECNTSSDCNHVQCCVSNTRPIGRKRRSFTGTCQNLGRTGNACLVKNEDKDSKGSFFQNCPCKKGYTCIPDGGVDIPLGPTGKCEKKKRC